MSYGIINTTHNLLGLLNALVTWVFGIVKRNVLNYYIFEISIVGSHSVTISIL